MASRLTKPSGALIKHHRLAAGLTYDEAAKLIPASRGQILEWEKEEHKPGAKSLEKIAKAYGKDITEFFPIHVNEVKEVATNKLLEYFATSNEEYPLDRKASIASHLLSLPETAQIEETNSFVWDAYRNPDFHAFNSVNAKSVLSSTSTQIMLSGATRTGKTQLIIDLIMHYCFTIKNFKALILRSDAVDLKESIRKSIKEICKYDLDHPLSPIKVIGGLDNFHTLRFPTGAEIVLGGLNRSSKYLGTAYDLIFLSQAEQSDEESYQKLLTRISTPAGNWIDENGEMRYQLWMDSNPDRLDHYLMKYKDDGLIEWYDFQFTDNPRFFRDNERTDQWSQVEELEKNLTGIWYERYYLGKWGNPEGLVYKLTDANLIDISDVPPVEECEIYRAMDFGMDHPSVCLWIAKHKETQNRYVFREWRKTHTDIDNTSEEIKSFTSEPITQTIIEIDENRKKIMQKRGIPCIEVIKGQGSVMNSILLVNAALRRGQEGKNGGLFIVKDNLVCNNDPNPDVDPDLNLIKEFRNVMFDENKDAPIKENDDATDAYRYFELYLATKKDRPEFYGSTFNVERGGAFI